MKKVHLYQFCLVKVPKIEYKIQKCIPLLANNPRKILVKLNETPINTNIQEIKPYFYIFRYDQQTTTALNRVFTRT